MHKKMHSEAAAGMVKWTKLPVRSLFNLKCQDPKYWPPQILLESHLYLAERRESPVRLWELCNLPNTTKCQSQNTLVQRAVCCQGQGVFAFALEAPLKVWSGNGIKARSQNVFSHLHLRNSSVMMSYCGGIFLQSNLSFGSRTRATRKKVFPVGSHQDHGYPTDFGNTGEPQRCRLLCILESPVRSLPQI